MYIKKSNFGFMNIDFSLPRSRPGVDETEEDEKLAIGHITFLVKTNRVILSP